MGSTHVGGGYTDRTMMICLPPQGTPPPHSSRYGPQHTQHTASTAATPHYPRAEDKPPQTRRPHSNGLCSPLSEGPDPGSAQRHVNAGSEVEPFRSEGQQSIGIIVMILFKVNRSKRNRLHTHTTRTSWDNPNSRARRQYRKGVY